ncbi:transposase, partial [Shigella flexneri]|nr:transposase [Shigella flexneri]EFY0598197.1 transposase [Shigella flexneri]EFY1132586.1 transposase [Shigella flexneri]EFY1364412.1 transposase [Shigella flexneri]EFY2081496.1 transposase [Shigella flexneri]
HYLKMMHNNITTLMASTPLTSQIN